MNSAFIKPLKSTRSGIALLGIAAMLSLSSCGLFPGGDKESTESSPSPSVSASSEAENADETSPSAEATEGTDGFEEAPPEGQLEETEPAEGEGSGDIAVGVEEPGFEEVYVAPEEEPATQGEEEIPEVALETSAGESIESAENRYLIGMKKNNKNDELAYSDSKLLDIGYETCEYYSQSNTESELFDKLEQASNGDHDAEVMYIYASGGASLTLCPEYEKAFE